MSNKEILNKIKNLTKEEIDKLPYSEIENIVLNLTPDEIICLSNIIGYPVFTRLCMGNLKHKFVLLQDGAAIIIENKNGEILLQKRADRDKWGIPGGCQELGESFEDTIIREIKEETNLDIKPESLKIIDIVSGMSRKNDYPNGDIVINNTVLYYTNSYSGELKWDYESKDMRFFNLNSLPNNQHDPDLIDIYKRYIDRQ